MSINFIVFSVDMIVAGTIPVNTCNMCSYLTPIMKSPDNVCRVLWYQINRAGRNQPEITDPCII